MSVGILKKYEKQPGESKLLNFDYREFLAAADADTISSAVVTAEAGLTISGTSALNGFVNYLASGGTDGERYTVTCVVTTAAGRVEIGEAQVKVKETS